MRCSDASTPTGTTTYAEAHSEPECISTRRGGHERHVFERLPRGGRGTEQADGTFAYPPEDQLVNFDLGSRSVVEQSVQGRPRRHIHFGRCGGSLQPGGPWPRCCSL